MLPTEKRIKTKKELKEWLKYERKKYNYKRLNIFSEARIAYRYNYILRKAEYYYNNKIPFIKYYYIIRLLIMQNKYQIKIPINTCDKGLKIMHVGSILINKNACVGKDCSFHINTALVAKGTSDSSPILSDSIVVGIGSVVVGGVKIAKSVAIGANSVVTHDIIEEDVAVAGNPARIISKNGRTKW